MLQLFLQMLFEDSLKYCINIKMLHSHPAEADTLFSVLFSSAVASVFSLDRELLWTEDEETVVVSQESEPDSPVL